MDRFASFLSGEKRLRLMSFSIIWIICMHFALYGGLFKYKIIEVLFGKGYLGVDIFFFLSAYGLCYSFTSNRIKEYYIHRFNRLFPDYVFYLIIIFVSFSYLREDGWVKPFIYQVSGLVTFTQTDIEWYIPALILLYALFPLVFKAASFLYSSGSIWPILFVVSFAVVSPFLSKYLFHLFPPRFPIILIGIFSYYAIRDRNLQFLLSLYCAAAICGIILSDNPITHESIEIPAILFLLSQIEFKHSLTTTFFNFIGANSLYIYLAQNIALNLFYYKSSLPFIPKTIIACFILVLGSIVMIMLHNITNRLKRKLLGITSTIK